MSPLRRLLAVFLLLAPGMALAQLPPPASRAPLTTGKHPWRVTLFQIDKSGTLIGNPQDFACTQSGCEQFIHLEVDGKQVGFLVAITIVPKGAYFSLQPFGEEVTKVIEFEKGFVGPLFLQVKSDQRFNATLRYTLTGPALAESQGQSVQLMQNDSSLVFQRRLAADLILKVALEPAPVVQPPDIKPIAEPPKE